MENLGSIEPAPEHRHYEELQVDWVELIDGPAAGGRLPLPHGSWGEFIVHHLPIDLNPWQDSDGDWHVGTSTFQQGTLGAAHAYFRCANCQTASYVADHQNPSDESQDGDLRVYRPYLGDVREGD